MSPRDFNIGNGSKFMLIGKAEGLPTIAEEPKEKVIFDDDIEKTEV